MIGGDLLNDARDKKISEKQKNDKKGAEER